MKFTYIFFKHNNKHGNYLVLRAIKHFWQGRVISWLAFLGFPAYGDNKRQIKILLGFFIIIKFSTDSVLPHCLHSLWTITSVLSFIYLWLNRFWSSQSISQEVVWLGTAVLTGISVAPGKPCTSEKTWCRSQSNRSSHYWMTATWPQKTLTAFMDTCTQVASCVQCAFVTYLKKTYSSSLNLDY